MCSPGGRRASGGSDSIAASLSVKENNVWLCFLCFVFGGRHYASGSLLFFPLPLSRTHTHPTLACDHRSINRISLAFFLIEWRAGVIQGLTRIFSPSRNICSTYGRGAAVWDSAASEAAASLPNRLFWSKALECFRLNKTLSRGSQKWADGRA